MVSKIAITGPESSGKTTLAKALARQFGTVCTPEFSRFYLQQLNRPYRYEDLLHIAKGQLQWQQRDAGRAKHYLFCDTDLIVIKVWSDYRFGKTDPWIIEQLKRPDYPFCLLCWPDIPWVSDPLRENPFDRQELLELYRAELIRWQIPFMEIGGDNFSERMRQAAEGIIRRVL